MHLQRSDIGEGRLASVDLRLLGARTGLCWSDPRSTVVGFGQATSYSVRLGDPASRSHMDGILSELAADGTDGDGPVAFAAFEFNIDDESSVIVPEFALVASESGRTLIGPVDHDPTEVVDLVEGLLHEEQPDGPTVLSCSPCGSARQWREEAIGAARDRIRAGELDKVVLARALSVEANVPFVQSAIMESLTARFPNTNLFAIDGFLGASPEMLVERTGRTVSSRPLAGTLERGTSPAEDELLIAELFGSEKDRREHAITIDWLLGELRPFCSYVDAAPEPSVLSVANVHHLGTDVEGVLSEPAPSILDLVAAVHPTPALGGSPQADAIELIDRLEEFPRGRYGGPVGWFDASGNGAFAVAVRCVQIDGDRALVPAGVGVVAESDPVRELAETQAKFRAILGSLFRANE